MNRKFLLPFAPFITLVAGLSGPVFAQEEAIARREAVLTAMSVAYYASSDALKKAEELKTDIDKFVGAPSEVNLVMAKLGWISTRLPFLQLQNFLWIDVKKAGAERFRGKLDGRPVAIDVVEQIIADATTYPVINAIVLRQTALKMEGKPITGFAVLEALMWLKGNEDHLPFLPSAANGKRRRDYLSACAQLLVEDLGGVAVEFLPEREDNTRGVLQAMDPEDGLAAIMTGQAKFVAREIALTRLEKPKGTMSYSKTTHSDILHGIAGVANVLAGAYYGTDGELKVQGTGVLVAVGSDDEKQLMALRGAINEATTKASRLPRPLSVAMESDDPEHKKRIDECQTAVKALAVELAK